jgi:hypothetical protein
MADGKKPECMFKVMLDRVDKKIEQLEKLPKTKDVLERLENLKRNRNFLNTMIKLKHDT